MPMHQLEITTLQFQNNLMHQLRVTPVSEQAMGKGLLKIRQHPWPPFLESKMRVELIELLQLFDVLYVIQFGSSCRSS